MQKNRVIIWGTFLLTLVLSSGAVLLPVPSTWPPEYVNFHEQLVVNIIMAFTHICGAVLFLANLDVYTARLRRAYVILSLGTLAMGLGTLQITIITWLGAWDNNVYAQSGATMLPFLLSGLIVYLGVRSFARLAGIKHVLTNLGVVLLGISLLVGLSTLLPHVHNPRIDEATNDILVGISVWSGGFLILTGLLARKLQHHTGALYYSAMKWLARALFVSGVVLLYQAFYTLAFDGYEPTFNTVSSAIIISSGLMWIRAGYAFALTKYYSGDTSLVKMLFGYSNILSNHPGTVVDMVTYAAGLVSNASDIDPLLDKVRVITAKLQPGAKLSPEDSRSLVEIYLKIEQYLVTKEAVRKYTRPELRDQLSPTLKRLVEQHESA